MHLNEGVDVINFSGGFSSGNPAPQSEAYRLAAAAGIVVVGSAGNSGAGASIGHGEPWSISVAAGTHSTAYKTDLKICTDGGAQCSTFAARADYYLLLDPAGVPATPVVMAADVGKAGIPAIMVRLFM